MRALMGAVAIMAAMYFQNHHERALCVMSGMGYLRQGLSVSRFNRRLHQLAAWLPGLLALLMELFECAEVFVIDSIPLPVCKRVRARRCRRYEILSATEIRGGRRKLPPPEGDRRKSREKNCRCQGHRALTRTLDRSKLNVDGGAHFVG